MTKESVFFADLEDLLDDDEDDEDESEEEGSESDGWETLDG